MARFADHANILCPVDMIPHKLAVLARRCEEIGRDPKSLKTSFLVSAVPVDSNTDARRVRAELAPYTQESAVIGTPDQIAEHVAEKVLSHGIGGLIVNMRTWFLRGQHHHRPPEPDREQRCASCQQRIPVRHPGCRHRGE